MIALSEATLQAYRRRMERRAVPPDERTDYLKWVTFYLDFCQKHYHLPRSVARRDAGHSYSGYTKYR